MIRSIISNLPIGRMQAEKRLAKAPDVKTSDVKAKTVRSIPIELCNLGRPESDENLKDTRPSPGTDPMVVVAQMLSEWDNYTFDKSGVSTSSSVEDDLARAVLMLDVDDESSISDLSFATITDDPEVLDPIPRFTIELYTTYAWDSDSYSLFLLEQQWFRLAKNSSFAAALYLQGLAEVLHTCRGIFANHKDETLYLVIDQEEKVYRLNRTNYRRGITTCCSHALDTMSAHDK
jgi:hypothetical protein